jgi:hypothetical protein
VLSKRATSFRTSQLFEYRGVPAWLKSVLCKTRYGCFAAETAARGPQSWPVALCLRLRSETPSGWSSLRTDKRPPCARLVVVFTVMETAGLCCPRLRSALVAAVVHATDLQDFHGLSRLRALEVSQPVKTELRRKG